MTGRNPPKNRYAVVEIDLIKPSRDNPRTPSTKESLRELANSIREKGLLVPITCRKLNQGYEIISGNRRFEAAKVAGLREVPVIIKDARDREVLEEQVIENLQREDLTLEEKYEAFRRLRGMGFSIAEMSKATGIDVTTIRGILRVEKLDPSVRSRRDIQEFAKTELGKFRPEEQRVLVDKLAVEELTARQIHEDILPSLTELRREGLFSTEEQERVRRKILEGATRERKARSILRQERGRARIKQEGFEGELVSDLTLMEFIKEIESFNRILYRIMETRLEYLDVGLVGRIFEGLNSVKESIEAIFEEKPKEEG